MEYEKRVKQVEELVDKVEWKDIESDDLTRFRQKLNTIVLMFPIQYLGILEVRPLSIQLQ